MKVLLWTISIISLIAFQGSVLNPFIIKGIGPDFILIAVYIFGIYKGEIKGCLMGGLVGFILDVTSAGPIYSNIFSKFFMGYMAGIISRWVQNPGVLLHGGMIFAASLFQGLGISLGLALLGMGQFPGDIIYVAIPQAMFDGFLCLIAFLALTRRRREPISRWAS